MTLKWLFLISILSVQGTSSVLAVTTPKAVKVQKFLKEPHSETVLLGSSVLLEFNTEDKDGTLQRTKDDDELILSEGPVQRGRYTLVVQKEFGGFWLKISPVTFADEGKYQCKVSSGLRVQTLSEQKLHVCVKYQTIIFGKSKVRDKSNE